MLSSKPARVLATARRFAVCCLFSSTFAQAAIVTPIAAEISYKVSIEDRVNNETLEAENSKRLEGSVGNLSEGYSLGNVGMTIDVNNAVTFGSPATGTLTQDYENRDTNPGGLNGSFTGRVTFTYQFSVDEATDVSIKYLANGTSSSISTTPVIKWWAMQGFQVEVRRDIGGPERLPLPFQGVDQLAPITYDDTLVVALPAGTHELYMLIWLAMRPVINPLAFAPCTAASCSKSAEKDQTPCHCQCQRC